MYYISFYNIYDITDIYTYVCIINTFTLSIYMQIIIALFLPFLSQMVWLKLLLYLNT